MAIGIEDDGEITGIDSYTKNINDILRAPFEYCQPSIIIETETVACVDRRGKTNHILLMKIQQSGELHAKQ